MNRVGVNLAGPSVAAALAVTGPAPLLIGIGLESTGLIIELTLSNDWPSRESESVAELTANRRRPAAAPSQNRTATGTAAWTMLEVSVPASAIARCLDQRLGQEATERLDLIRFELDLSGSVPAAAASDRDDQSLA